MLELSSPQCVCGKSFSHDRYLTRHMNNCQTVARRRRQAEEEVNLFRAKKRQRNWRTSTNSFHTNRVASSHVTNASGATTEVQVNDSSEPGPSYRKPETNGMNPDTFIANVPVFDDAASSSQDGLSHVHDRLDTMSAAEVTMPSVDMSDNLAAGEPAVCVSRTMGRGQRKRFQTWKLKDMLPEGPGPLVSPNSESLDQSLAENTEVPSEEPTYMRTSIQLAPTIRLHLTSLIRTLPNSFGLYRIYRRLPSTVPDEDVSLEELGPDVEEYSIVKAEAASMSSLLSTIWPYPNYSSFLLGKWSWQRESVSQAAFQSLIDDVLADPAFRVQDVLDIPWNSINTQLAKRKTRGLSDDWTEHTVSIRIPIGRKKGKKGRAKRQGVDEDLEDPSIEAQTFNVSGVWVRSLVSVIKETFTNNPRTKRFHFEPFKQYWEPPDQPGEKIRVYDELYTCDDWLKAHEDLQNSAREPDCPLPRAIIAMMFWSDATCLAQFGTASLWPVYLQWGNQSKYERSRPSTDSCQPVAYFPKLPDEITDFIYKLRRGKAATQELLTHCRRELFHEVVKILLDSDFQEAYIHGIIIELIEKIWWRMHPRIFTWSADHPEKVYLASIKDKSEWLCTCCECQKARVRMLGMLSDRKIRVKHIRTDTAERRGKIMSARQLIYEKGYAISSERVQFFLREGSWAPTENAFSAQLSFANFNYFQILACDLMHEIELGVWKNLLIHLIRMLYSIGASSITIFNQRFRQVPPFGRSIIRPFENNVSELKKLAAHNYEDILLCIIPVIEGLFPEPFNGHILGLIWELSVWHALAKLRMHTDLTLAHLDTQTTAIGKMFRHFVDEVSPHFDTYETPAEVRSRARRNDESVASHAKSGPSVDTHRLKKQFNINTFKFHQIGHYVSNIQRLGTTDSYSTVIGERAHRVFKARYRLRTNKRDFVKQLAKIDSTMRTINGMEETLSSEFGIWSTQAHNRMDPDPSPATSRLDQHTCISGSTTNFFNLGTWCEEHESDPAVENFIPRLKDHLLTRLLDNYTPGDEIQFTTEERNNLFITHNRIYTHNIMRINYTTYDIRREQDYISLLTRKRDIIVEANEEATNGSIPHPYWYARVHGIFHVQVRYRLENGKLTPPEQLFFLWVRWFGRDLDYSSGWQVKRLDRIGFVPSSDPQAFGFLDPKAVIRSCHLIPALEHGRTEELCPKSMVQDPEGDWQYFYVNRFVDRDMFIRYLGNGVGHAFAPPPSSDDVFGDSTPEDEDEDEDEEDESHIFISHTKTIDDSSSSLSESSDEEIELTDSEPELDGLVYNDEKDEIYMENTLNL